MTTRMPDTVTGPKQCLPFTEKGRMMMLYSVSNNLGLDSMAVGERSFRKRWITSCWVAQV